MIDSIRKVPLLSAAAAIGTALIFLRMFRTYDIMAAAFLRFSLAALMAGCLYLISGRKTFEKCFRQTEYAVTILSPILIYAILLSLARFYLYYSTNGGNLAEGWPVKLASCLILMMSVGLFEELMCRAVLCDAFIYQFRSFKGVFVLTGIAVSFIFGFLHVAGSPVNNPLMLAQAVLKTVSTGILGFSLLMIYWKTRDAVGCAVVHALYDFLLIGPAALFGDLNLENFGGYVLEGSAGKSVVVVLCVDMMIELVLMALIWRKVMGTIDFEEMRRDW